MSQFLDVDGNAIRRDDLVEIVEEPTVRHGWMRRGNILCVSWMEHRLGMDLLFLESKGQGRQLQQGIAAHKVRLVKKP